MLPTRFYKSIQFLQSKSFPKYRLFSSANPMASSSLSQSPSPQIQKFDYLLVIDFEATCDRGFVQPIPQEIIEFPCMKVNTKTWKIESQFHQYVRPVANPTLTSFCTELTGIVQDMVDGQPDLAETLALFDQWLKDEGLLPRDQSAAISDHPRIDQSIIDNPSWAVITCGDWDLKSMLRGQCDHFGYERADYFRRWINVKKIYFKQTKVFPKGMMQMLDALNLNHEGKHHSGIDDVRNIVHIVRVLGLRGAVYDWTSKDQ